MPEMDQQPQEITQKIKSEMKRFIFYTLFLTFFFAAFTTYQRLLLNNFHGPFIPYGYSLIQGLILAKVIMIGRTMKLGERYSHKPLIIPVLHKTIVFCLLLILLMIAEHLITGCLIQRKTVALVYEEFINRGWSLALAKTLVTFFVFILFFSVLETSRILGENKLFNLFFRTRE